MEVVILKSWYEKAGKVKIMMPMVISKETARIVFYAIFRDMDDNGRIKCESGYGGYNNPDD